MDITLPAKLQHFVESRVKDGDFTDESDVVREALRFRMAAGAHVANVGGADASAVPAVLRNVANGDIEAIAFIVLMQAARSMDEDLKMIMARVKAATAAKARLRELISKVGRDVTKNAGATEKGGQLDFSAGLGNEAAYHIVPMPVADVESSSGITLVETDLYPERITRTGQIQAVLDDLDGRLDSLSDLGEMESLRLQMIMDRRSKSLETLSNVMKKLSETASSITQNLK